MTTFPFIIQRALRTSNINGTKIASTAGILIGASLIVLLVMALSQSTISADDKKCLATYGAEWTHTTVGTNEASHAVCLNETTKEEKPVPGVAPANKEPAS